MEIFKLKKPDTPKLKNINRILGIIDSNKDIFTYIEKTNKPVYLFWDKIRYLPRPEGITAEEFWATIKFFRLRSPSRVRTIVKDKKGDPFTWQPLPGMDYFLHEVDMSLGGAHQSTIIENPIVRRRFIFRGIMEEAIASSQLEGASTTRKQAKRMLTEKRKPKNQSEKMIVNNYQTMLDIEERHSKKDLSIDLLFDLHTTLTQNTIEDDEVGRFRRDKDEISVSNKSQDIIYHIPPKAKIMKEEIKRLVEYANDDSLKNQFVHPVIKAIILHFWIGYLHPFTDGNGRMARSLFYWYLLKKDYWAISYLPISRVIRNSPVQYRDAYVYSEQDDNDLTYFIDYNIRKIEQAKREFDEYVKRKMADNRKITEVAQSKYNMNDRQIQLLRYFHKNKGATATIKSHALMNDISRMTARKDLELLESFGFLISKKQGRVRPFKGTNKITEIL